MTGLPMGHMGPAPEQGSHPRECTIILTPTIYGDFRWSRHRAMNNLIQASGQPCEVGALVPFFRQKADRYNASAKVAVLASGRNALQIHPHLTTLLTFLGRVSARHCSCTHILPEYTHSHTHVSGTQSLIFFFPLKWTQKERVTDCKLQPQTMRRKINL